MALFKILKGSESTLDQVEKNEGYAYFCSDTGAFYVDIDDSHRKPLSCHGLIDENGNIVDCEDLATIDYVQEYVGNVAEGVMTQTFAFSLPTETASWNVAQEGETGYVYTKSLSDLRCGADGTTPPIIICTSSDTTVRAQYSTISKADATVGVGITFSVPNIPTSSIPLLVIDFG